MPEVFYIHVLTSWAYATVVVRTPNDKVYFQQLQNSKSWQRLKASAAFRLYCVERNCKQPEHLRINLPLVIPIISPIWEEELQKCQMERNNCNTSVYIQIKNKIKAKSVNSVTLNCSGYAVA